MTWTKLSDDFADEAWTLSDAGFRLLVEMLNWSNRKLLDLKIPKDELRRFAKCPEAIQELVAGDWVREETDHFLILFHGRYQPLREQVIALQKRNQENGRKGGRPPKAGRERAPETQNRTQMGSQLETHGDGTGRDGAIYAGDYEIEFEVDSATGEVVDSWPVREPGSGEWVDPGYCKHGVTIGVPCSRCEAAASAA